ncbi:hypothetical protein Mal15_68760 [Stieleria maiorica]|uniref:DUF883 domain-containing protein n=1 Tax=Stieleria maiorica TaxID=2795974 RepID=A0A5B9MS42_9BACT|nr:hypothetical protein [Stieleria maiorica]QEG02755.1 hypothetical protein Mal15_68760 [Stieleria maiorica]
MSDKTTSRSATSDAASTDSSNHSSHDNGGVSNQARQTAHRVAAGAMEIGQDAAQHYVREPAKDLFSLAKDYAKDHPDVAACWAFGLGVIVGWKLKP